jgi:hypothetical protein
VFNPKVCVIAGGAAFVLSFLIGVISGGGPLAALVRALIFGALFVLLSGGAYWALSRFLPELFESSGEADLDVPGSRVDISEAGVDGEGGRETGLDPNADSFGGNVLGLDQNGGDGYTLGGGERSAPEKGEAAPAGQASSRKPAVPVAADDIESVDVLPDLEAMSDTFLQPVSGGEPSSGPARTPSGNKPQTMEGDFNAKEMASAIQTILKREGKG